MRLVNKILYFRLNCFQLLCKVTSILIVVNQNFRYSEKVPQVKFLELTSSVDLMIGPRRGA